MRILVDARGLLERELAGIEHYTYFLLNNLQRMYPEDEYILFSYSRSKKPNQELAGKFEWRHFDWSNLWMLGQNYFLNHPEIDRLFTDIDLVWFPNIRYMPVSPQVKKVMTIHDLSSVLMPDCYSWERRLWHSYMESKWRLTSFDGLVAVSANTADDIAETYQIPAEKIKVIYSGVTKQKITADWNQVRQKYKLPVNYHVFVSTIEPRKNLRSLLRVMAELEADSPGEFNLVVLGAAGWEEADIFTYLGSCPNIYYPGYVAPADKISIISQAQSLLYPSFYEGFGFPPLEAMQLNVPVVASHAGALGEILGEAAILVDPFDIHALKTIIIALTKDPIFRGKMAARARSKWTNYSWAKTARELREWFAYLSG